MRIRIVCPAPPNTLYGNRITALRWARILRGLGHRPVIAAGYDGERTDLLLALHAKRSAPAVFEFNRLYPERPVLVALTGTDVYRDIHKYRSAQRALEIATRVIALQPLAAEQLAARLRSKVRIIHQSVAPAPHPVVRSRERFQVCVVGHLRSVKDPFRAALAVRDLPASSRIQVLHAGAAMTPSMAQRARSEQERNARYRWIGELPRWKVRRLIGSSHALVLSSKMEGGANVISEALVGHTPVVASRIPGSVGLLGPDYPAFYPFGKTEALQKLLLRLEEDASLYSELTSRCVKLAPNFDPERELSAWRRLLGELGF